MEFYERQSVLNRACDGNTLLLGGHSEEGFGHPQGVIDADDEEGSAEIPVTELRKPPKKDFYTLKNNHLLKEKEAKEAHLKVFLDVDSPNSQGDIL